MKKFQSLSASLVVAFIFSVSMSSLFVNEARGEFAGFPFGTNAVIKHCVSNSMELSVSVYQQQTNGKYITVGDTWDGRSWDLNIPFFSSKEELDTLFHKQLLKASQGALTNSKVNRDKPFWIFAYTLKFDPTWYGDYIYFNISKPFSLIKSTDGIYSLPDLSKIDLEIGRTLTFDVPQLKWARVEVCWATNLVTPFEVDDPRYEPDPDKTGIHIAVSRMCFYTEQVLSGTNGPSRLKIMMVTGSDNDYQVFDSTGAQIPETPCKIGTIGGAGMQTSILQSQTIRSLKVTVTGGDSGRVFVFQYASDLDGPWSDIGNQFNAPEGLSLDRYVNVPVSGPSKGFYRVRAVPLVP